MTENAGGDNAAQAEVPPLSLPEEVTKATVRKTVWDYIMKHRLANFPLPVYQRIPNVKGAEDASKKLAETDVFKNASTIKSNPDKPQEAARYLALEDKKTLLVPTPRLRTTLFTKLTPPEDANEQTMHTCATSQGIREHSQRLELNESVKIDLVLLGSVAVSRQGYRIGKGDGFFDLEYAMMRSVGAVDDNTPVVTTVQDFQVIDLPESMFSSHDVRVDYIVTPTQVINCGKHTQPKAINWSMLTEDRLNRIPVLKKLRLSEFNAGKNVSLKDEEDAPSLEKIQEDADAVKDDDENEPPNYYRRRRRYRSYRRRPRPNSEAGDRSQGEEGGSPSRGGDKSEGRQKRRFGGRRRYSRRRRRTNSNKDHEETGGSEGEKGEGEEGEQGEKRNDRRRRRFQRRRRGNSQTEGNSGNESAGDGESPGGRRGRPRRFPSNRTFSVYVGGLPSDLRVSEFKREVRSKDVNPIQVVWHGNNGHAFLVFTAQEEANSALTRLSEITIKNTPKKLRIEVANRSRGKGRGGESGDGGDEATTSGPDDVGHE